MKRLRTIILFISVLSFLPIRADEVQLRVEYLAVECIEEGQQHKIAKDMTLDIGNSVSLFYYRDTVDHAKYPIGDYRRRMPESYSVMKNYPKEGMLLYKEDFSQRNTFGYEEDMPQWEWKLLKGDSTVLCYPCKKATASFRGRTWYVWYTIDLPYNDGPWKLYGLPGLILEAEDATGSFLFKCCGIAKGDKSAIIEENKKFIKASSKRIQQLKALKVTDFDAYYFETTGIEMQSSNNKRSQYERKPCLIEIFE